MSLSGMLVALVSGMALTAGGAIWFRATLDDAFRRGHLSGIAEVRDALREATEKQQRAAEAALAEANHDVAALETERDRLQEKIDELARLVARASVDARACLDADLVRALAAIGAARPAGQGPDA